MTLLKNNEIYELKVQNLAYGGKGFAKINNFSIFIRNGIPGDIVKAKIIKKHKKYAEAIIVEYLSFSNERINPPCDYSNICGGCTWQSLKYENQLNYKQQHVIDAIKHISLIKNVKVNSTIPSDLIFEYRNKMEFSCSDRKWLINFDKKLKPESWFGLGLHVPGTFYKVLDISKCLLQPNIGNNILTDVRSFMKNSKKPPYGLKSHNGFWRFLVLRHSVAYDQWMVNIVTSTHDSEISTSLVDMLSTKYNNIASIMNSVTDKKANIAAGDSKINLFKKSTIRDKIGIYKFDISVDSFFQTNTRSAEKLYKVVREYADLSGNEFLIDLYCGTGTIAIYLSDRVKKVVGIEIIESAIIDAKNNCKLNGITNCNFIQGDVKDILLDIERTPDIMIIDPPRVGVHKKVLNRILQILPKKLIYVSCNPSTLARDLLKLKEAYKIKAIQPVDMFPHTYHIEIVVKLNKK